MGSGVRMWVFLGLNAWLIAGFPLSRRSDVSE